MDAGPLKQATDALLMYESRASHAIRRYITSAVRNASLNYFRIKFMSRTGVNGCCQNFFNMSAASRWNSNDRGFSCARRLPSLFETFIIRDVGHFLL